MTPQPIHGLTNAQLVERARELLPRGQGVARRIHRQVMLEGRFDPERFVRWLRVEGLPVRQRVTKGHSVMAACGQLGNPSVREELRALRTVRA